MDRNLSGASGSPVWLLVARLSSVPLEDAASCSGVGVDAMLGLGVDAFPDQGNMWGNEKITINS